MATTAKTSNPGGFMQKLQQMDAGTKKDIPATTKVTIAATPMTGTQISTQIETYESSYGAVTTARTALKSALAAWAVVEPAARQFVLNYTHALKAQFGAQSATLADFGINPAKPKSTRTAADKAVSSAMAVQTKALRGVKGKKQKAAITSTGKPGLALVTPDGQIIPSNLPGPTPPGQSAPVAVSAAPAANAGNGSSADSSGGTAAPTAQVTAVPSPSPSK